MVMSAERISGPPRAASGPRSLRGSCLPVLKPWGAQRLLRCLHVNARGELINLPSRSTPSPDDDEPSGGACLEAEDEDDGGLEAVRAKLMGHLREAAERVQLPAASAQEREEAAAADGGPASSSAAVDAAASRWNLRARTAVRKVSRYGFEPDSAASRRGPQAVPVPPRPRFSVSLSSREIAEDVYAVTGALPRRRPRKRSRTVQRQLDALFPCSWLEEITPESYKVSD